MAFILSPDAKLDYIDGPDLVVDVPSREVATEMHAYLDSLTERRRRQGTPETLIKP